MTSRRLTRILLLLGLLAVLASPAAAQEAAPEVKWRFDYTAARKEAQEKALPLVIDFETKKCYWCRRLDETTFRDAKVAGVMNERFIPLKVDAEQEAALAQALRIGSYPTVVLAGPDGRILSTIEGYQEADKFHDGLQRVLAGLTPPDGMNRDLQNASKWAAAGDFARAIPTLKAVLEEGKAKALHPQAHKLMQEIEQKAGDRLAHARQLHDKGQTPEAIEVLSDTMRLFPGAEASKAAAALLTQVVANPEVRGQHRAKRARDLLAQARDFYKNKEYIPCLDRCEVLLAGYGDLEEGQEASKLSAEIKSNPEWLQGACDTMSERLGGLYLALAESLLKRGQPQRAEFYLQRVIQAFPGSRQAESAQIRLGQLQGLQPRRNDVQSAGQ